MTFLKKAKAFVLFYIRSEDIPLRGRMFNLITSIAAGFILINSFTSPDSNFVLGAIFIVTAVLIFGANKTGKYQLFAVFFIVVCGLLAFPFLFLTNEGISGGMVIYMVFGAVIVNLLIRGKACVIVLVVYLASIIGLVALDYYNKLNALNIIKAFESDIVRYYDVLMAMILGSVGLSLLINFQNRIFDGERKKVEESSRVIEETSAKLRTALDLAEIASKAKGDFLSNMSHEMRTPMNAIIGMTVIGKKTDDIAEKDRALKKIEDAASHLLGIINDVLDMAKIEADKLELTPVEYSFEKMLQKVASVINFRVDEKRQNFTVFVDNAVPRFTVGDDQRLAQVIANLLSNAVKFTPEGGDINLKVSLREETDEGCMLCVEVTDSGIGISPEQQKRLFRAFEQLESGTSREYGGTGLGLVISRRIVELMGGEIWVESELGAGSRFTFTAKVKRGSMSYRTLLSPGVNWKNVRIMVVDDMVETRNQFADLLGHLEIRFNVAADGYEALEIIEQNGDYDIYFIDWQMPGIDGIELTRQIKARSEGEGKRIAVIMITALDWDQIKYEAAQAGVDKHLLKPLFSSAIIDCINECLGVGDSETEMKNTIDYSGFEGKRMLLAEDIEINREILMSLLDGTGIVIDCAENGREAVKMIEAAQGEYDIVFMDVQMPEMDGLEATRRIRALAEPGDLRLPIVAMTANVFKDDIDACISAGMDDHLGKPLDIDKVLAVLQKYFNKG